MCVGMVLGCVCVMCVCHGFTDLIGTSVPGGGALNFFSGRGVRPGFPNCGFCELIIASEKGVLRTENFKIWGFRSKILAKIGVVKA